MAQLLNIDPLMARLWGSLVFTLLAWGSSVLHADTDIQACFGWFQGINHRVVEPVHPVVHPPRQRIASPERLRRQYYNSKSSQGYSPSVDRFELSPEGQELQRNIHKALVDLELGETSLPMPLTILKQFHKLMADSEEAYDRASGRAAAEDRQDEKLKQGRYRDALEFFFNIGYLAGPEVSAIFLKR